MKHPVRIDFSSYDGVDSVRIGNGDHCVMVMVGSPRRLPVVAAAVLTDDEAEALGWNLIRQARYSRARQVSQESSSVEA